MVNLRHSNSVTPSHVYSTTLSLLITSWHKKKKEVVQTWLNKSSNTTKKEVVQTQLLSSSFKHDLMKVVQTQLNEKLFKHNFYHHHSNMT